jgi:hypothetical protein
MLPEYSTSFFDADEYLRRTPAFLTNLAYISCRVAASVRRRSPLTADQDRIAGLTKGDTL